MRKTGFAPILDVRSEILVLGTFPSEKSLEKNEYYAHSGNQFWKIISAICSSEQPTQYDDKIRLLLNHQLGLWDVYRSVVREGSADVDIKDAKVNDFRSLIIKYPNIKGVLFGSKGAETVFAQSFPDLYETMPHLTAFSPSGAYAKKLSEKINNWDECIRKLKELWI